MLFTPSSHSDTPTASPESGAEAKPEIHALTKPRQQAFGDGAIAAAGFALSIALLASLACLAGWEIREQADHSEHSENERIRSLTASLAPGLEALLAQDDLPTVRRIVADAVLTQSLSSCKLVLPNGRILATSGGPERVTAGSLPESWSERSAPPEPAASPGTVVKTVNIRIAGRGMAFLQVTSPVPQTAVHRLEAEAAICGAGALGMTAIGLWYRRRRQGLKALHAVRDALLEVSAAGSVHAVNPLNTDLGPEAVAWNLLIAERSHDRKDALAERAREALGRRRQSRGDLDAACDAMSQGLILIDDQLRVKYTNGAAASFLRIDRDKLGGSVINQVIPIEKIQAAISEVAGGSRRRAVIDIERAADPAAGPGAASSGVLRFSIRPVRREDSASAMIVIEDITQQKAAEEARHAFVAQATHELRTPLTNIRLYVETAIEDGDDDPAVRSQALNVINGETRRLERIVSEMLSVAEIEAGHFKLKADDIRLDALFEELKHDYSEQAKEKKITLSFLLPPKFPVIIGDRDKVAIALHNLVGNALKYTPDGGGVTVRIDADDKRVSVAVCDTGIGIAAEDCEKVFDRFFRANDRRVAKITGTGLGLTIAREVARLHGGDITVESQLDKGSTFTLVLPLKAA